MEVEKIKTTGGAVKEICLSDRIVKGVGWMNLAGL
jgi:hypothetical protein